jgi:arsenate reductase
MTAHWGIADPAAVEGDDGVKRRAFNKTFHELDARIKIFTSLRLELLDRMALQRELDALGRASVSGGQVELLPGATS